MDYIVNGGNKLSGSLHVYGAKNCVLACLAATLLTDEQVVLTNCPDIVDVTNMAGCLTALGKRVCRYGDVIVVDGTPSTSAVPREKAVLLRGSALLLGPLVARSGNCVLPLPGGCAIGARPMDIHVDGLRALGADVETFADKIECRSGVSGGKYALRFASVGATENLICAAVCANGRTELDNCAREPEIAAMCRMLNAMGARIDGIGRSRVCIEGVDKLHGTTFAVIPDRIVAATYIACGLSAGGELSVVGCPSRYLSAFVDAFGGGGAIRAYKDMQHVSASGRVRLPQRIVTAPYPGFHTDMQSLALSLAATGRGKCTICENLFENRLAHNAEQLNKMGGNVQVDGRCACVTGGKLHGANVTSHDLRGGAALICAALAAEGTTVVSDQGYILRGYCNLAEELASVGGSVVEQN